MKAHEFDEKFDDGDDISGIWIYPKPNMSCTNKNG